MLLNLVNDARRKAGVSELKYDADLNALCEMKMLEKSIYGLDTFTKQIQYDGKTIADGMFQGFTADAPQGKSLWSDGLLCGRKCSSACTLCGKGT